MPFNDALGGMFTMFVMECRGSSLQRGRAGELFACRVVELGTERCELVVITLSPLKAV